MSTRNKLVVAGAVGLLLTALPAIAKQTHHIPVPNAVIENTGSTNTQGYTIVIYPVGGVGYHTGMNSLAEMPFTPVTKSLTKAQASKLFTDLKTAMPLTDLPVHHGMRSASFGTQTFITYKGQKSPDLTFASDPRTVALKADIDAITKVLYIGNVPRRPIVIHANR